MNPANMNIRKTATAVIAVILFVFATFLLHRLLKQYHFNEIRAAFHAVPMSKILGSLSFTALSYLFLTFYDTLAFRYIGNPLAYKKISLASFISYTFANNTGSLSILTSSSIRYRFYSGWDFSSIEIARIIWFCMTSFVLGYLFLAGISFLVAPPPHIFSFPLADGAVLRIIGFSFLLMLGSYLTMSSSRRKSIKFFKWDFTLPPLRLAFGQVAVAGVDLLAVAAALYVLLPGISLPFYSFVPLFLLAIMIGLISNVPGGLGVFESVMLLMLTPYTKGSELISALLLFRFIYYLLPLVLAVSALGGMEIYGRRTDIARVSGAIQKTISIMIPPVFALAALAAGGILLFSGTIPRLADRVSWLIDLLPLSVLELSHFLGSMVGMGLIILASGLRRRLNTAYFLTIILLILGIFFSLLKGLDYEEASMLGILLLVLSVSRRQFYRQASFLSEPVNPAWLGILLILVIGSFGLGLFVYRHQSYSHDLWWQFALHGDASRFMRASVGVVAIIFFWALARLFKVYTPPAASPGREELAMAAAIAARTEDTHGYLALLGDKALLFSPTEKSFLMYGVKGRSWIAMGDPVGEEQETEELIWEFKNLAERYGGWPVFYEVGHENLYRYIDLGMTVLKIGEDGRVNLAEFTLEGSRHKGLRYIHSRLAREGCRFEIVPPAEVSSIMPDLRAISDDWLNEKKAGEKGFSLGFFSEEYLHFFPVAIVRYHGKIQAFANLWQGGGKKELSIDLMRYGNEAPHGIMDYIFCEILLWGKGQGYEWFSLGMVPLAGLEPEKIASLWGNIGTFVYRHGEHFYNFRGLRGYKDKFDPVWQPKYLVAPGDLKLPAIFSNLTALIGGSLRKIIAR